MNCHILLKEINPMDLNNWEEILAKYKYNDLQHIFNRIGK